jgi:hypothetical protein
MKPQTKTVKSVPHPIFKLQNGLNATLLGPKSPAMKRLRNACTNKDEVGLTSNSQYAVKVKIKGECVYIVYEADPAQPFCQVVWKRNCTLGLWWRSEGADPLADASKDIVTKLQNDMEKMLQSNMVIIHDNVGYLPHSKIGRTLINAVINRVTLDVAAVLTS